MCLILIRGGAFGAIVMKMTLLWVGSRVLMALRIKRTGMVVMSHKRIKNKI
jgi:hypothetical protein